jgi:hypothetical protein
MTAGSVQPLSPPASRAHGGKDAGLKCNCSVLTCMARLGRSRDRQCNKVHGRCIACGMRMCDDYRMQTAASSHGRRQYSSARIGSPADMVAWRRCGCGCVRCSIWGPSRPESCRKLLLKHEKHDVRTQRGPGRTCTRTATHALHRARDLVVLREGAATRSQRALPGGSAGMVQRCSLCSQSCSFRSPCYGAKRRGSGGSSKTAAGRQRARGGVTRAARTPAEYPPPSHWPPAGTRHRQ